MRERRWWDDVVCLVAAGRDARRGEGTGASRNSSF